MGGNADLSAPAAASLAGVPVAQAPRALAELTRAHLVIEHLPGRYALHDLLRGYARELAVSAGRSAGRHAASRRLLDHYPDTAHAAALLLNPARQPLAIGSPAAGVTPESLTGRRRRGSGSPPSIRCCGPSSTGRSDGWTIRRPGPAFGYALTRLGSRESGQACLERLLLPVTLATAGTRARASTRTSGPA